ncbi:MAG: class I SAM-dependent methyltransferase [Verrucomicrobiae bacterium]|nr:class I SAM-dependent methyltransferase [Verrucomicrobiae bacterium]
MSTNKSIATSTFATGHDRLITCRNSQGIEVRATPLRMTRHVAVFEVYNPFSILQLSEVLSPFAILVNDRMIYSGRAVVSGLVNTGILLVCEVSLDDVAWLDVDVFSPTGQRERLAGDFELFLAESRRIQSVMPDFKVVVADMQTVLTDLRNWLEQVELGVRSAPSGDRAVLERQILEELRAPILPVMDDLFGRLEVVARGVELSLQPMYRTYIKRQLHPLVLCSPFAFRTFQKPLGYAGDYEMVNMILRDPLEGASLFAKTVNLYFLNSGPALAHRNRIQYLIEVLRAEALRAAAAGRPLRVLNLGCGPAGELQWLLEQDGLTDRMEITLLDFNDETLDFVRGRLEEIKSRQHRSTAIRYLKKSVHQLLKEGARASPEASGYDLIYCAGLFDYLSNRVCQRLMNIFHEMVAPGGLLVATNVDPSNPARYGMEFILDWHLTYRDSEQMKLLHPTGVPADHISTRSDDTGVNIYLEVRNSAGT